MGSCLQIKWQTLLLGADESKSQLEFKGRCRGDVEPGIPQVDRARVWHQTWAFLNHCTVINFLLIRKEFT